MTESDPAHTGSESFPPNDCRPCGRCCFSDRVDHVRVFACDEARMGPVALGHTLTTDGARSMDMSRGYCSALVPDAASGHLSCSIYQERPDVCRWLERGTGSCKDQFDRKAGRPEAVLVALRLAR